jgi:hypothetical protein
MQKDGKKENPNFVLTIAFYGIGPYAIEGCVTQGKQSSVPKYEVQAHR